MSGQHSFLFFALICSFGCAIFAANSVPVPAMIWKSDGDAKVSTRSISALIIQSPSDFQQIVSDESNAFDTPIVVFFRNSLCTEDFKCRQDGVTCHRYLSHVQNTRYVPAIQGSIAALRQMNQTSMNAYVTTTDELSQPIGSERIIFVELSSQLTDETDAAYNSRLDRSLAGLTAKLQDKNYLYVLTANECAPRQAVHSRKVRDVATAAQSSKAPASPASTAQTLKNPNLLVYFTELVVFLKNKENHTIEGVTLSVSDVTAITMKVELKADQWTIAFDVNDVSSSWFVQNIVVNGATGTLLKWITAPVGFSYKCSPQINITVAKNDVISVGLRGLQLQPKFGAVGDQPLKRFGDVNDCVGFTSIGIWSGLIVSFLLLAILTLGLSWILDIRTMDRFDDPKGAFHSISIYLPQNEKLTMTFTLLQEKQFQ